MQLVIYFYVIPVNITVPLLDTKFIILQILHKGQEDKKPGRQYTMFFFLFNISQWLVLTFEIQKFRASLIQSSFYGVMPWIIIQRVTLPLAVFFRFHSAVISIELWKGVYLEMETDDGKHGQDITYLARDSCREEDQ